MAGDAPPPPPGWDVDVAPVAVFGETFAGMVPHGPLHGEAPTGIVAHALLPQGVTFAGIVPQGLLPHGEELAGSVPHGLLPHGVAPTGSVPHGFGPQAPAWASAGAAERATSTASNPNAMIGTVNRAVSASAMRRGLVVNSTSRLALGR